ncbi:MAG: hypothetical protein F3743_04155 [Nitrospinae bacterium]|nr:hypothetical protein [Nitrospinota bacterium]MZH04578.1 hypothetical protein [Nitrospinota bacterium]MZH15198.1 hypothetical protein [Nitrospinota bacterium]
MKKISILLALITASIFSLFFLSATAMAGEGPMKLPEKAKADAKMHNKEGIKHWEMGHYDVALGHFKEASKIDGSSGEIHFNEAISYDKLGQHGVATKHFGVAKNKASGKNKEKLLKSPILNGHLGH